MGASPRRKASTRAFAAAEGGKRTRLGAECFMGPIITFSATAYLAVAQDSLDFALSAFASPSAGPTELALRLALPRAFE